MSEQASLVFTFLLAALMALGVSASIPQHALAQNTSDELSEYLEEMIQLAEEAREASLAAENASSIDAVKEAAESVYHVAWGLSSGRHDQNSHGATSYHGWQIRWQTSPADYDEAFAERLGTAPPTITDPRELGIIGRGRYIREHFAVYSDGPTEPGFHYNNMDVVAPLNNAIGWMRLDNGITKGELQPRIDLTYVWDEPIDFWKSTASTGWVPEALAQASNILKTDYAGDLSLAREHASSMTALLDKVVNGEDVNGNGRVESVPMEGGLQTALESLRSAD